MSVIVLYGVNFQNIIVFKLIKIKIVIYHKSDTIRSVLLMTIFFFFFLENEVNDNVGRLHTLLMNLLLRESGLG